MTLYHLAAYPAAETALLDAFGLDGAPGNVRLMPINVYVRQNRLNAALEQAVAFIDENPDAPERNSIEQVREQIETALGR